MNWSGAIVAYVMIWWVVFFAVLPWGVVGRWESADDGVEGADPGAPVVPDLRKKVLITSAVAFAFWAALFAVVETGVLNFRD